MEEEKKKLTFAEKFNLVGIGVPIRISKRTLEECQALHNESNRIIQAGEDFAKTCKWTFGPLR